MLRVLLVFVFALLHLVVGRADDVRVVEPRTFGHFLGDRLTRTIEIDRREGEAIVAATLPPTGPAAYWLEIANVESSSRGAKHIIKIDYQIFYAPIDPRKLDIPGHQVSLEAGGIQRTVQIPPVAITVSPLREIFPDKEREREANLLRPDADASLAPLNPIRYAAAGSGLLALTGLLLLARHNAWPPFRRVATRPFTRAAHEIDHLYKLEEEREAYAAALTILHRAFDERAGRRVFANDVEAFLAAHAEHQPAEARIQDFFDASREVFFAGDVLGGAAILPAEALQVLSRELARQERAVR
jgi:mxaA protein